MTAMVYMNSAAIPPLVAAISGCGSACRSSAFLAGWMDWLAHAVAGSLYAVFGTYIVWGLRVIFGLGEAPTGVDGHGHGTLFGSAPAIREGTHPLHLSDLPVDQLPRFQGTGKAGNIITVAKIVVIAIFIAAGLIAMMRATGNVASQRPPAVHAGGFGGVLVAMGLTFIAFEGYEIIVQAGEEVEVGAKHPKGRLLLASDRHTHLHTGGNRLHRCHAHTRGCPG